jgi:threonine/homoserine/homoserine lactone efflux protein
VTTLAALWSFALVVGLLTLTPGLDTALILRTSALRSARQAWGVVLGIQSGTLIWGVLTAAGVSALLTASHLAYEILRWAGVAYLAWIGGTMLRSALRRRAPGVPTESPPPAETFTAGWRRGLLTNLLNPKMGAFYVALLPQFIPPDASALLMGAALAGVHVALGTAWSAVLVLAARRMRRVLARPAPQRVLEGVAGVAILGFGAKLAATRP